MAVMIIRNGKVEKTFKKFFPSFVTSEIEKWINEHFKGAVEKRIDKGSRTIYIFY